MDGHLRKPNPHSRRLFSRLPAEQGHANHTVIISIQQEGNDELLEALLDVSDPSSVNYGKHWPRDKIGRLVSNWNATNTILFSLQKLNTSISPIFVDSLSLHGEYITCTSSVAVWNSVLNADFQPYRYAHSSSGNYPTIMRTEAYTVPEEWRPHILDVFHTVHFSYAKPPPRPSRVKRPVPLDPDPTELSSSSSSSSSSSTIGIRKGYTTPALITQVYGIDSNAGHPQATQGVYASGQYLSPKSLASFQALFGLPVTPVSRVVGQAFVNDNMCNGYFAFSECGESLLDVEYMMGISPNCPTTFWADTSVFGGFLSFAIMLSSDPQPPLVVSISYGIDEYSVDDTSMQAFNIEAAKAGLAGITIVASSGDSGAVGANVLSGCTFSNGITGYFLDNVFQTCPDDIHYCDYNPSYPASSPYVTAVGATSGPQLDVGKSAEEVCTSINSRISSGGGFSQHFPRPIWQKQYVDAYQKSHSYGNKAPLNYSTGRGYPDISALGVNYLVYINGNLTAADGTSASAPVIGGMFSLINAARMNAGKGSIGFANPALYAMLADSALFASAFNDVVVGSNNNYLNISGYSTACTGTGFSSAVGWDPSTGLGTPKFGALKGYFVSLGSTGASTGFWTTQTIGAVVGGCAAFFTLLSVSALFLYKRVYGNKIPTHTHKSPSGLTHDSAIDAFYGTNPGAVELPSAGGGGRNKARSDSMSSVDSNWWTGNNPDLSGMLRHSPRRVSTYSSSSSSSSPSDKSVSESQEDDNVSVVSSMPETVLTVVPRPPQPPITSMEPYAQTHVPIVGGLVGGVSSLTSNVASVGYNAFAMIIPSSPTARASSSAASRLSPTEANTAANAVVTGTAAATAPATAAISSAASEASSPPSSPSKRPQLAPFR